MSRLWFDNICFAGQPMGWALVAPGISPMGRLEGVREPVLSSPSIRLYKYSIYDGKVGKQIMLHKTDLGEKKNGVRINAKAFFSFLNVILLCKDPFRKTGSTLSNNI